MELKAGLAKVYMQSEDVVARDVQGEFIIIPITSGISETGEEIFSLNKTGRAIWGRLDGKKRLKDISIELSSEFKADPEEIEKDVLGFTQELFKRKMVVEAE